MKRGNNVHLWTWHKDGLVKVTVKEGETIAFSHCYDNGEGHTVEGTAITHHGTHLTETLYSDGTDCDGRHSSKTHLSCRLDEVKAKPAYDDDDRVIPGVLVPAWALVLRSERDFTAEKEGY